EIATGNAEIHVKSVRVIDNVSQKVIFEQDFTQALKEDWQVLPGSVGYQLDSEKGLILPTQTAGLNGLYIINDQWTNYRVEVNATKVSGPEGIYVGVGVTDVTQEHKTAIEYAIGYDGKAT